ncbi:MAG: 5-oxoprolinase subunit PxpA [Candidatus Limnocylindria bacterium]
MTATLNCDMGESFGLWSFGDDEALMPLVSMANVACGFHAGDPGIMRQTVALAKQHGVGVGAHPSYPDLQGFGRRAIDMDADELTAAILYQAGALKVFLDEQDMPLTHLKPHGALYGRAAKDEGTAHAVADAAEVLGVPILGMAGTLHESVYTARGLEFLAEYFVDLDYADDGSLQITRQHAAYEPEQVRRRLVRVFTEGVAVAQSGREIPMRADTVCVHSDTPGAPSLARAAGEALREVQHTQPR